MKQYIYIIATVAILFLGCAKSDTESQSSANGSTDTPNDGKVTLALNLKLQGSTSQSITTRATEGTNWAEKENVTKITGYAFVFGNDPTLPGSTYGDNSPLLQKVAFKSIAHDDGDPTIYVTFDEYKEPCFIRLMTSMTQSVQEQIEAFTSQKQITDGDKTGDVTTFAEYKHISVTLSGYYNISDPATDTPNPNNLTPNQAFPLASPGISMPNGLIESEIEAVNKVIYMVPAASKVDVSVGSGCGFALDEVTLLNGARWSRLRSTILEDDGITPIYSLPLPINLGGIAQYAPVSAINNTTANTPIYFFPNKGDGAFSDPADPDNEYPDNGTSLSDEINTKNPTYLIIKGRATGYNATGYYKIAIVYKPVILGEDGKPTGENELDFTYDIIRNNHYKVNLNKVDNPGYATFDEAVAGVANNISYDITIGSGNSSTDDTFTDSRAETIISHSGLFYIELVGSEIYAQGYGKDGVKGNFALSLTRNQEVDNRYDVPTLYITTTDGITINNNATISADNFAGVINFTATQSGIITLRCGDMVKEIPVYYSQTPHIYQSGATIGGASLSAVSSFSADDTLVNDTDMITPDGTIAENTTYTNREFRGKAYPTDMSKGIRKVYVKQASNFEINTYYDNSDESSTGGNSATNNIFATTSSSTMNSLYTAFINYQSTGKVYQLNSINQGSLNSDMIMDKWWIGAANIEFTAKGEFTSTFSGAISNSFSNDAWTNITNGTTLNLNAAEIGSNQIGSTYDASRSQISDSAVVTLTNIAGQTKTYNIDLNQYAAPYISGDSPWYCPGYIDIFGLGIFNNLGELLGTTYIYNASYVAGEYPVGDYKWVESPTQGDYTGGSTGMSRVEPNARVDAKEVSYASVSAPEKAGSNLWRFNVYVNENINPAGIAYKGQAYFDLRVTNKANEEVFLRMVIRREQ